MSNEEHHLVIARYQESLNWLYELLRLYPNIKAYIYNDGPDIIVPQDLSYRIIIKLGDKIPAESTKYMQYILDNYSNQNKNTRVTFLQADPIYHSPDFFKLFECVNLWDDNYQNLCLYGHPPPWLCASDILNNNIENIKYIGKGRIWSDIMKISFHGIIRPDEFINQLDSNITIPYMCSCLDIKDVNPYKCHIKAYAACFSTSWNRIYSLDKSLWSRIINFVDTGENTLAYSASQKTRAIYMEYMWSVIFHNGDIIING